MKKLWQRRWGMKVMKIKSTDRVGDQENGTSENSEQNKEQHTEHHKEQHKEHREHGCGCCCGHEGHSCGCGKEDEGEKDEIRETLTKIIISSAMGIVIWIVSGTLPWNFPWWAKMLCFAIPYLIVGGEVLLSAGKNIVRGRIFDEQFLMAIATVGAFAIGEYPEAVFVMIFYQIGEMLGDVAVGRSRRSIAKLMDIRPDTATVIRDGHEIKVSPEDVKVGEIILLRPGDRVPLDGVITEGETTLDTAALTGESLPSDGKEGDAVWSGSVNLTGAVKVRVTSGYGESTVARILELVEDAYENKAKSENFITRFSRIYTPAVVISACVLAVLPSLVTGEWGVWIYRGLSFLVASCPCALVISVPLTFFCGLGAASSRGILIKGSNYLEVLSGIDTVVFDKTGTLTKGSFSLTEIRPAGISADELLSLAASAEERSTHPVGRAITAAAEEKKLPRHKTGKVTELAGQGVRAEIDDVIHYVGNEKLMKTAGVAVLEPDNPGTAVHVSREEKYLGCMIVSDQIKSDTFRALEELKRWGISRTVMLTGDNEMVAAAVAERTGVDEFRAGLFPEQKVEEIERYISEGNKAAFVGDGINDAPVLARADLGIAMGMLGSDAAVEAADVVIMDDKLSRLPYAIALSRRTMRIVRENIIFALTVKFAILALSAAGLAGMWLAAFGDVGVMLIAVLNALRALRTEK